MSNEFEEATVETTIESEETPTEPTPPAEPTEPTVPTTLELDLTKESTVAPLLKLSVGTGWDMVTEGTDVDMDLTAFALVAGKLTKKEDVCYFNNKSIHDGAIMAAGDNRTGEGEGNDEALVLDLAAIPADVDQVVFILNIFESNGVSFDDVASAYIRAWNTESDQELARVDVSADTTGSNSLVFAKVRRDVDTGNWIFESAPEFKSTADLNELTGLFM